MILQALIIGTLTPAVWVGVVVTLAEVAGYLVEHWREL